MTPIEAIRKNILVYDEESNSLNYEHDGIHVQFQDRHCNEWRSRKNCKPFLNKVSTSTWSRVWINGILAFNFSGSKYESRQKTIKFLLTIENR